MPCTKAFWKHKQKQSTNKQTKNSRNPVAQSGENLVPWSTPVWQVMTADGYKLICLACELTRALCAGREIS